MKCEPLHIIQNARRRALIKVLRELGGEACLREVVRRVAEGEAELETTGRLIKNVHVSMLQTHIPKMERAGLIEYDRATDTVHLLELPLEFRYHLEVVEKRNIPWSLYYLVLSTFGVAVCLALGDPLAGVLATCFLVAAIIHAVQTRGDFCIINGSLTRVKHTLTKYLNRPLSEGKGGLKEER